jgi:transposase
MTISIIGFDLFFPMDVDKKRIHVCVMDRDRVLKQTGLPNDPVNLLSYARKNFPEKKRLFVYEAGPTGYGLCDYLREQGEACEVAVPSMIPKAPGERVKTNRLDAYRLGTQLKTGELKEVNVPTDKYRDLRHLARLRMTARKRLVATKNAIKGLFLFESIPFPEGSWSRKLICKIREQQSRPEVEFKIATLLQDLEYFAGQELKVRGELKRYCRADEELRACVEYLMSLPGIGWIISTYILGALGGHRHLKSAKKTCGFLGLGSSENSTGETVRRGSITAVGDPDARRMVIQAAWKSFQKDPELKSVFDHIYYSNPENIRKQKAIVAVGRTIVCRIHAVLRDQRFFEDRLKKAA